VAPPVAELIARIGICDVIAWSRLASSPHRLLGYELAIVIVVKILLLCLLYWLFFSPAHRPVADTAKHVFGDLISIPAQR
jgi:hypothetical protein